MALPLVVLLLSLLLHAAVLGADVVVVHGLARDAARLAAVASDADVAEALVTAVGTRPHEVAVDPPDGRRNPGDLVTARVRISSRAFATFGHDTWLEARATMRVEDVP